MRQQEYLPIGKDKRYNLYHDEYDRLRLASKVLSFGSMRPGLFTPIWNRSNILIQLKLMEGQSVNEVGDISKALIPATKQKLTALEQKFAEYQKKQRGQGKSMTDQWPTDLLEARLRLEASLDVYLEEVAQLKKWLETLPPDRDEPQLPELLPYGLVCSAKLHGLKCMNPELVDVIEFIDGQKCSFIDEVLCITDDRSPFKTMSLEDYRKLAGQWRNQRWGEDQKKLVRLQEAARKAGQPVPAYYTSPRTRVSIDSLPAWPEWAEKHIEKPKEEDELPPDKVLVNGIVRKRKLILTK